MKKYIKTPEVSVIVATYNDSDCLETTIKSFLSQTYKDKELIIIDSGSKNGAQNIIKKYKSKMVYRFCEPKGVADAFNVALKVAKGDFLYFIGAGDFFWSEDVLDKMMKDADCGRDMLICGRINRTTEDGKRVLYTSTLNLKGWMLLYKMGFPHQGLFTNKKFFQKYGEFDLNCKFAMDYEILLRAYGKFPRVMLKDIIVAAWREGGIGKNKTMDVMAEYHRNRVKNKIAPIFVLNIVYLLSKLRYIF